MYHCDLFGIPHLYHMLQASETGLYICMNKYYGFGKKYVENYSNTTGNRVFLHLKTIKKVRINVVQNVISILYYSEIYPMSFTDELINLFSVSTSERVLMLSFLSGPPSP